MVLIDKITLMNMKIYLKEIKEYFPEFEIKNYDEDAFFTGFCHDSREVVQGDLYMPIVGEKYDGHSFIIQALDNGCSMALCENSKAEMTVETTKPVILVDSVEEGIKKIVNYSIGYIKKPVVAITGSTGKTTTKKMLTTILENHMKVLTANRYNTVWGNAVLLGKFAGEDIVVLECAMDRKGEISWHVNTFDPDLGILLNICEVHAEKIGSIDDIVKEKKDLADYMERTGKPLILNIDDPKLKKIAEEYNKESTLITFGTDGSADFQISDIYVDNEGTHFKFRYYDDNVISVSLGVFGEGYAYDAMAAIIAANELGVGIERCVEDIKTYVAESARFEKLEYGNLTIINDGYNANPVSMRMSVETFCKLFKEGYYTIAILGDMRELGEVSSEKHKEIGEFVKSCNFNEVYYVGEYLDDFGIGEKIGSADEVAAFLNSKLEGLKDKKVAVLLKASKSIGLYQVPDFLKKLGAI